MKRAALCLFAILLTTMVCGAATVITNNTAISPLDASYDGADIVVSNCTVTVNGAHSFNSVLVVGGGVLTHTYLPGGTTTLVFNVKNEQHILDAFFPATLLNSNVTGLVTVTDTNGIILYTNGVDYIQTNLPDGTTQIYATTNSAMAGYAVVLVSYTWTYSYNAGLYLSVTNDLNVAAGGSLNANGIGYGPGTGSGHGSTSLGFFVEGSGAGHGGGGGASSSDSPGPFLGGICYGSLNPPTTLGSGGGASYAGNGGGGGGRIQITAGGTVNIDGLLSANGADATNSRAGGGAGGSIWITATNFSGAGSLTANGGAGEPIHGGGGGGGRISIQCGTNYFAGSLAAYGGNGWNTGGAGTVFIQTNGQTGLLVLDNGGRMGAYSSVNLTTLADILISGGAGVIPNGAFSPRNLMIATNSSLTGLSQNQLSLTVNGNLTIQAGGKLTLDALGYAAGGGSGPGQNYSSGSPTYPCGGGGHGGYGGAGQTNANGGTAYGSQTAPTTYGSGGGTYSSYSFGGAGGGAVQLNVAGTLQVDGLISANGGNGSGTGGGGGGGGSIYIASCTTLSGAGNITANGGNGVAQAGGGGGGGRIAVNAGNNNFTGSLSAWGGGGTNYGGAGTVFTQFGGAQQLTLDNGGHPGTNTLLASASPASLVIQNGAKAIATATVTFNNLLVNSNGWLTHVPAGSGSSSLSLIINNNATIQPGGGFMGDMLGKNPGLGSGAGGYYYYSPNDPCGGGGYGGKGGNSNTNAALGGVSGNDTAANPSSSYSGSGGGTYGTASSGGSGGGYFSLTVGGTLQLDGILSANGGNASGLGGGGGAGGGVYLNVGTFSGGGSVSVIGGNGVSNIGGGGGGGRIAIYFNANNFTGALAAFGGSGANYGGGGTIYLKTNSINHAQVIVDNAGHAGADTVWNSSPTTDLILRNGSSCYISGSQYFNNLTVGSNCWLFASNGAPSSATINAASITVQPGGGISADLAGYNANAGYSGGSGGNNSTSPYYPCGGGGHGGYGAASIFALAAGGTYYDTPSSTAYAGSGGGSYSTYSTGGKGGGVLNLSVTGNVQMDGTLSANGGNGGGGGGGGGAGGSLNLSCTALAGAGSLAVHGGNGVEGSGGGGAGGMIRVSCNPFLFSGSLSAYGGGGANYGGAGTIYLQTNSTGQSVLIADNGGHRGTNTPLVLANNFILRNGATAFLNAYGMSINSLLIASNAWLVPSITSAGNINLTVLGNATIQAGGGIYTDAAGSAQNAGTGHGGYSTAAPWYGCSGGGHGGYGAAGSASSFLGLGSPAYDSTTAPTTTGSGGGGYSTYSVGGSGGGYVRLTVNGTLQLDGSISANGGSATIGGGGGGAGGGIYLSSGTFAGAGSISASGGNGTSYGGGGGGGRIAVNYNNNNFTGTYSAYGGGGYAYGGAGTIYTKTNSQNYGLLVLDNGNNAGTKTVFDFNNLDVTVQNRAIGLLPSSGSWSAHTILIRTNSALAAPGSSSPITVSANTLTVDAGGALSMDSGGNGAGSGTGLGYWNGNYRGGGGYGGFGGGNLSVSGYGKAYGSITSPASAGSGGGSYQNPPYDQGGAGGGALQLSVSSLLTVNGRLSANGGTGDNYAGGGSGGSLYLAVINQLAGSGVISANGGAGGSAAGGGGGGRIALICNSNGFTGQFTAMGGNGIFSGGAGTVYTSINGTKTLAVDNGGLAGTNTPLDTLNFSMPAPPFDLNVAGAAVAVPVAPLPLINNLNLAAGSTLTMPTPQSGLVIAVQNNASLAGKLIVDNLGYAQSNGPGTGTNLNNNGSGGGYGGAGGNAASGAAGGSAYGSAAQPTAFGSGGGSGVNTVTGGAEGGGAIRLSVGGTLTVNGNVSANGDYGWQDNSGGGAGGSLWISATTLAGLGTLSAAGGNGDFWNGGGGGGGRIAIYAPTNLFTGTTNISGGLGAANGQPGTLYLAAAPVNFLIGAQSPSGTVSNTVSYVDLYFNEAVDPASVSATALTLTTPGGVMGGANLSAAALTWAPATVRVSFPVQNPPGNYSLQVAPTLTNILGRPLALPYTGSFAIALPMISGTVSDTNGAPVPGVSVQPDGGLIGATTDTNGNYSIGVPPGWNGTVTPALGTLMFVPGALGYTNVTASLTNQNYLMVPTVAPAIAASLNGTNLALSWSGIPGVTYQTWASTNLVDWSAYGSALAGTNGPMQFVLPVDNSPSVFFRILATH